MDDTFRGKRIWLLGASTGIGNGMARALVKGGSHLTISARNESALKEIQSLHPEGVDIVPLDLAIEEERSKALAKLEGQAFDIIIYNAGVSQRADAAAAKLSTVRSIMEVNFFGAVHIVTEALLRNILKPDGQVVIMSSVAGYISTPKRSTYSASKHALHGYFNSLRAEWKHKGLSVTVICPGYIETGIDTRAFREDGSPQQSKDLNRSAGMPVEDFVHKALSAVAARKAEVHIGGKEILAIYLQRLMPQIVYRIAHRFAP